jgi:SAM-dependent methyltransferase
MAASAGRAHWDAIYEKRGETGVSWFQEEPGRSLDLICRFAPPPARVTEIGGGASRLVDRLLDAGYGEITVVDVSAVALAMARARLGARASQVCWLERDINSLPDLEPTDVWHDRAVYHFLVDDAERRAYADLAARKVVPGGILVIATFAPSGPEQCSGLPVHRADAALLAADFSPEFALLEATSEQHSTPGGAIQDFTYAVFRRADNAAGSSRR